VRVEILNQRTGVMQKIYMTCLAALSSYLEWLFGMTFYIL
ncbi:Os12g0565800, partial [Oryza sativa Japonica Group]